jgi:hypothetical protein
LQIHRLRWPACGRRGRIEIREALMDQTRSGEPRCARGHAIVVDYTAEQVRTIDVLVFYCDECDDRWEASPEERDAFLRYLESHPGDAVPS